MRYTILVLGIAALCVQNTLAKPEPNIISDILKGIGQAGQNWIDGIRKTNQDSASAASNFANGIRDTAESYIKEAQRINENIAAGIRNAAQDAAQNLASTISAFAQTLADTIAQVRNSNKRRALQSVQTKLKSIESASTKLQSDIEQLEEQARKTIESQEAKIESQWNSWADDQLSRVADATDGSASKEKRAQALTDEFISRASGYLDTCSNDIRSKLEEYGKNAEKTIAGHQNSAQELINEVQTCLSTDDSLKEGLKCSRNLRLKLIPLAKIPADFARLKSQGTILAAKGIEGNACTIRTKTLFSIEKANIEQQLNDIIKSEESDDSGNQNNGNQGGSGNQGSGNQGSDNQGSGNQGSGNQGTGNQGSGNQGSGNQGSGNQGSGNQGSGNQGSGSQDSGNQGSGNQGSGSQGSGSQDSGNQGSGNQGSGNQGSGNQGSGNQGSGSQGSGSQGSGNQGSGNQGSGNQGSGNQDGSDNQGDAQDEGTTPIPQ